MSFIGGLIHGITNVTKLIPGPVGMLSSVANRATGTTVRSLAAAPVFSTSLVSPMISPSGPGSGRPEPGMRGAVHRMMPGGSSGYLPRRHINVANVKALRRAGRRMEGFLKLAHKIEKQLPHKIVHVKAGKRR